MASDKTINQLTLAGMLSGDMRFPAQPVSGPDVGVQFSQFIAFVKGNNFIGVSGGIVNPDPATGNNGDLYFQSTGGTFYVKQKVSGNWTTQASFNLSGAPAPVRITGGTTASPLVVQFTSNATTTGYLLIRPDGSRDYNTKVTYDGTNFTIHGDTSDGTHFTDSYTFQIKP